MEKQIVVFRKTKENEIIAFFPEPATQEAGNIGCYAHIGQHGGSNRRFYRETIPATPDEYQTLEKELREQVGYNLLIRKRLPRLKTLEV